MMSVYYCQTRAFFTGSNLIMGSDFPSGTKRLPGFLERFLRWKQALSEQKITPLVEYDLNPYRVEPFILKHRSGHVKNTIHILNGSTEEAKERI